MHKPPNIAEWATHIGRSMQPLGPSARDFHGHQHFFFHLLFTCRSVSCITLNNMYISEKCKKDMHDLISQLLVEGATNINHGHLVNPRQGKEDRVVLTYSRPTGEVGKGWRREEFNTIAINVLTFTLLTCLSMDFRGSLTQTVMLQMW